MELVEDKNKRTGLIGTIIFHGLLLILFIFCGLTYLEPPPEEEGITINFGTSDQGMGDVQPREETAAAQEEQPQEEEVREAIPTPTPSQATEEVVTQSIEEAPKVSNAKKPEPVKEKEEPKEEPPQPSEALRNALNKFKNNPGKPANEGETGQPGDQGRTDGDVNSRNREGGGSGAGFTFNLAGRKITTPPKISDDSQDEGKVVVDIVVDKYGRVVRAVPGGRGSTTTSPILYRKAKEAAMQTTFSVQNDGPVEQKGQMTFIFILN